MIPISGRFNTLACLIEKSKASASRTKLTSSVGSAISFPSGGLTTSSGSQYPYSTVAFLLLSSIRRDFSPNSTSGFSKSE